MDREQVTSSRARRWRVVRVDASLVALEYNGGELCGHALAVDTAQRVVRSGRKTPIAWPHDARPPMDAEWIHAARVEDTQLAISVTVLVFRSKACDDVAGGTSPRPMKRARRDPTPSQPTVDETRLYFYAISDSGVRGEWNLQSLGDVVVDGEPANVAIHVVDGPYVVAFNATTSSLSLLQPVITDEGDYAFSLVQAGLELPGAKAAKLISCQLVSEDVATVPHLLLQYTETQVYQEAHDVGTLDWRPPSLAKRRQWAVLSLPREGMAARPTALLPCSYLPAPSDSVRDIGDSDNVTSCAVVSPSYTNRPHAHIGAATVFKAPRLRSSTLLLIGTSVGTLRVVSNDVVLASYVVGGLPRRIEVEEAHVGGGSRIVAAISCADSDRSFHLISVDACGERQRVISPLQHFTSVGDFFRLPAEISNQDLILLNDVTTIDNDDFVPIALRKSVTISYSLASSHHVASSCHRLKHRSDDKQKKRRGTESRDDNAEAGSSTIERVKIDKHEQDFDVQGNTGETSRASAQQLEMLTKSLQKRLRVGSEYAERLERVWIEKTKMITRLNELLIGDCNDGALQNVDSTSLELVPVVTGGTNSDVANEQQIVYVQQRGRRYRLSWLLDRVAVVSFERSTSMLQLSLTVRVESSAVDDEGGSIDTQSGGMSVFAFDHTRPTAPIRSWSRVRRTSPSSRLDSGSPKNIDFELTIDVPPPTGWMQAHLIKLGLWFRNEPGGIEATTWRGAVAQPSSSFIGDIEVDLAAISSSTKSSCAGAVYHGPHVSPSSGEFLLLSGGSSVHDAIAASRDGSSAVRLLKTVRPLFAVLSGDSSAVWASCSSGDQALSSLIRQLPRDVVAMVNPLARSSLQMVRRFIELLQSEIDQVFDLEHPQNGGNKGDACADGWATLVSAQQTTDLQALSILNELQRRVDFHSSWMCSHH